MIKFRIVATQVVVVTALLLSACTASAPSFDNEPVKDTKQFSNASILCLSKRQAARAQLTLALVRLGNLSQHLEFSSVVEAPPDEVSVVSPQISGVVSKVLVDVGDQVQKGQVLLYISSPDLPDAEAAYFHALSKLEEVRAEASLIGTRLQLAEKDEQRLSALVKEGISAKRDLEAAQSKVAGTSAELVASESAARAAQAQLSAARIRLAALGIIEPRNNSSDFTSELPLVSPSSGVVLQRNVLPGQLIGPSYAANQTASKPCISIAKLSKVWVMLEVPQSEVHQLKLGRPVQFHTELAPGKTFSGKITRLGENFDPLTHCVLVRTEINNSEGYLKPGTLVIASAFADPTSIGPIVPKSAIQDIDGQKIVFKQTRENCFQKTPIQILSESPRDCIVQGAILPGSSVVDHGSFFLKTEAVRSSMGAEK